jgi:tripartite-type tricarboxylate transporter receptor subunit TctC
MRILHYLAGSLTYAATLVLGPAARAEFPDRDVRIICGFAPGGACDIVSRMMADAVAPIFRQRVIVENRAGAGGKIAMEDAAACKQVQAVFGRQAAQPRGILRKKAPRSA